MVFVQEIAVSKMTVKVRHRDVRHRHRIILILGNSRRDGKRWILHHHPDYAPPMLSDDEQRLQTFLEQYILPRRQHRMRQVLSQRTRHVVCVLEDLYDPRNGSAVMRHCDALGIHEIHAVESRNRFRSDEQVDLGTAQWLDIRIRRKPHAPAENPVTPERSTSNSTAVLKELKSRNYRIVATSADEHGCVSPEDLDLNSGPVAVVFGSEKHGISDAVRAMADVFLHIPMVGFVKSFNISAGAAIIFHVLSRRLRKEGIPWQLENGDARRVLFNWVKTSLPHAGSLIERFTAEGGIHSDLDPSPPPV